MGAYDDISLKKKLFRNVYIPEYKDKDTGLFRQLSQNFSEEHIQGEIDEDTKKIKEGIEQASRENRPLSDAEMAVVRIRYVELKEKSDRIRKKVKLVTDEIDFNLTEDPFQLSIGVKKPALKKAMKIVFGLNTDDITYEQYKEALSMKSALEKEDIDQVFGGE